MQKRIDRVSVGNHVRMSITTEGNVAIWNPTEGKFSRIPDLLFELARMVGRLGQSGDDVSIQLVLENLAKDFDISSVGESELQDGIRTLVQMGVLRNSEKIDRSGGYIESIELRGRESDANSSDSAAKFLVGAPRSGTTIVGALLNAHPELFCAIESNIVESCFSWIERTYEFDRGISSRFLEANGIPIDEQISRICSTISKLYADMAHLHGKSSWVEKTIYVSNDLDRIDRLFAGRSKYVFLVRHPLEASVSMARGWAVIPKEYRVSGLQVRNALLFWTDYYKSILDYSARNPDRCMLVRFEELRASYRSQIASVFRFFGVSDDNELIGSLSSSELPKFVSGDPLKNGLQIKEQSTTPEWKSWERPLLDELGRICNETMARLGYEKI